MSDDNTPAPASESVRADVSGDFHIDDYAIDTADQHIADQILALDPVFDMPGTFKATGDVHRLLPELKLTGLPPHVADPIKAQLANMPEANRAAKEKELVEGAYYGLALASRVKSGPGALSDGATIYHQEFFEVAQDAQRLNDEFFDLTMKLAEVDHVKHSADPRTGAPVQTVVNKVDGERRRGMEVRLAQVQLHIKALEAETPRRLAKALKETVEKRKEHSQALEDHAEVERRAVEIEREDRIDKLARQRAKIKATGR